MNSDCDFIIATTTLPSGSAEAELCRLHNEIPTRAGFWTKHLEGSYADITSLRDVDGIGVEWLLCDHGYRELKTWAPFDIAWTQRYTVSTYCRVLYTLHTAEMASKRGALEWARDNLEPKWGPLLTQVIQDRALGWDPAEPPRPGSLEAMYEFAAYAESFAR